jgi:hypothetical protein
MRHSNSDRTFQYYTSYSPATFVKKNISISLFKGSIGVMIKTDKQRRIPYWYDGHQEELTRDMNYLNGEKLDNDQQFGQLWKIKESLIACAVQLMNDEYIEDNVLKIENDKHNIFTDKRFQSQPNFSWNEGLFRYKKKDVFAIYVSDKQYLKEANILKSALKLNLPILFYENGILEKIK